MFNVYKRLNRSYRFIVRNSVVFALIANECLLLIIIVMTLKASD